MKPSKILSTTIILARSSNLKTVDQKTMEKHCAALRKKYPKATRTHQIVDRESYNISTEAQAAVQKYGIILHHLPIYSFNLNPIERLWKVMNLIVRLNNQLDFTRFIGNIIKDRFI